MKSKLGEKYKYSIKENIMRYMIYELWNPITDVPIYVGWSDTKHKGSSRPYEHLKEAARNFTSGNQLKMNIIRKIIRAGSEPIIKEIYYTDDLSHSYDIEVQRIAQWGRRDLGNGTLANMTDGGEGVSNRVDSIETRQKKADGRRGKRHTAAAIELIKQKRKNQPAPIWSDESRAKMSKNTWLRNNKGKTLEEIYGTVKAASIKQQQSIAQTLVRQNEPNPAARALAHRITWVIKMKDTYIAIFNLLDQNLPQYKIVQALNVGVDTVRRARLNREEFEQIIAEHDIEK